MECIKADILSRVGPFISEKTKCQNGTDPQGGFQANTVFENLRVRRSEIRTLKRSDSQTLKLERNLNSGRSAFLKLNRCVYEPDGLINLIKKK